MADVHGAVHIFHRDIELRSTTRLQKTGAAVYAAHPTTEILCVSFAVDDQPVRLWLPGDPLPPEAVEAKHDPRWVVCAHNDPFETQVEQYILGPRYGWPLVPPERHRCTMAACLSLGLPAKLGTVADVLELENRKDRAGKKLMQQMSKPRKPRKGEDPNGGPYWFDDEERKQRLYHYCKQDTETERELHDRLPLLSDTELTIWLLSNAINARGFGIDRAFAEAAKCVAAAAGPEIDAEITEITGGTVTTINQITKMQLWLQQQGCNTKKLDRTTIAKLLGDAELLSSPVRRVLQLRSDGAQAAVKKINALLARAGDNNRVRGAFRYHGASTGRWSGEGTQPQNLKRPVADDLDAARAAVATGDYQYVKALYPRPLAIIGDCSRSMICAAPGHTLIGGDFGSIESRGLAWVTDEQWKLDAYRRFDATHNPHDEVYVQTAAKILGVSPAVITKEQRGIGKICDLAFGYQGGLGAWRNFQPDAFTDAEVETFKTEWRTAHPKIRQFWHDIDQAAVLAVQERGQIVRCGCLVLKQVGAFLQIKLPSGRKLSYAQPRIIADKHGKPRVVFADNSGGRCIDCRNGLGAYGGLWTENIVSGVARDLLAEAMLRLEAAGYKITLHVHDEIVAEVPIGFGSTDEFTQLMIRKPAWALGLPVSASAWMGPRYCK